jgi:hypothetical protein
MVAAAEALGTEIPNKRATDNDAVAIDLVKFIIKTHSKVKKMLAPRVLFK